MKRLQIYIDEDLDDALALEAARTKRSKAAIVREAVRERLGESDDVEDPFAPLIGAFDFEPGDIDEVVYGS